MINRLKPVEKASSLNLPSMGKKAFRDNLDSITEQLNSHKEYLFQYNEIQTPNLCTFFLTSEPTQIGTTIRLTINVTLGGKAIKGFVYTTIPNDKSPNTIAILNKGWSSDDYYQVEGTGLMKLATATLMGLVLKVHSIAKFGGILGKIVPDHKVVRSRPNGKYDSFNFDTTYNNQTRALITRVTADEVTSLP